MVRLAGRVSDHAKALAGFGLTASDAIFSEEVCIAAVSGGASSRERRKRALARQARDRTPASTAA